MPRGNGTGPAGMGPKTGRAAGYCAGYGMPGYMNPYGSRMIGMRFGSPSGVISGAYTAADLGWYGYPAPPGLYRGAGRPFVFRRGRGFRRW